jgi:hypothetical protein
MSGLDTDQPEGLWVVQWQFHKLMNLCHLFVAPANVFVSYISQVCLFIFSFDRVSLCGDGDG